MSNTPTIGPGQTEVCMRCVEKHRQEYACKIADYVEQHPEITNGDACIKDLIRLRRAQYE
jgi:hypothetical protein